MSLVEVVWLKKGRPLLLIVVLLLEVRHRLALLDNIRTQRKLPVFYLSSYFTEIVLIL